MALARRPADTLYRVSSSTNPLPRPFRSDDPGAILPRAASVALWLPRVSAHPPLAKAALKSIFDTDEPHTVTGPTGTLAALFEQLLGSVVAACAVFPVPGDVASVPMLAAAPAVESEEAVLLRLAQPWSPDPLTPAHSCWALVPEVTEFGSRLERGYLVDWTLVPIGPWEHQVLGTAGSLASASAALRAGLLYATDALAQLDVASWREEHAHLIELLRDPVDLAAFIPPDLPVRQVTVLSQAARLRAIVDLARLDEGGSVNVWQADQRLGALREIDSVARQAMTAATLLSALTGP